jgi:hypothetical protein
MAVAQKVAVGVEGGVRTTGDVSGSLTVESKRYIVGPRAEIRLPVRQLDTVPYLEHVHDRSPPNRTCQ